MNFNGNHGNSKELFALIEGRHQLPDDLDTRRNALAQYLEILNAVYDLSWIEHTSDWDLELRLVTSGQSYRFINEVPTFVKDAFSKETPRRELCIPQPDVHGLSGLVNIDGDEDEERLMYVPITDVIAVELEQL